MKTFTIVTPVYNGEKFIEQCITHIANMNYDINLIQHIIVDDGSTDNTKTICLNLLKKYKHLEYYSKSNGNWGSAINYVRTNRLAKNEYIVICDADDFLDKNAFNVVNLKCNNDDVVVGNYTTFVDDKKVRKFFNYFYLFRRRITSITNLKYYLSPTIVPTCIYIKNNIFYKTNKLTEKVMYQDTVYYMNCLENSNTLTYIPKTISYYRKDQANNTMSQRYTQRGLISYDSRFNTWVEKECIENMALDIMFAKPLRSILIQSNKTYTFNRKPSFKLFPIWMRIFVALIYKITCGKIIKINKEKTC